MIISCCRNKELRKKAGRLLGAPLNSFEQIGGFNSKTFRAAAVVSRSPLLIKKYPEKDERNRLNVEYAALKFLREKGINNVPEPIAKNEKDGIAVYSFIEGKKILRRKINKEDIIKALELLGQISSLSGKIDYKDMPEASEACFSVREYEINLKKRIKNIHNNIRLEKFLKKFNALVKEYAPLNGSSDTLPAGFRHLSPSDVGFHNILKAPDGNLFFIDFEYFGWDDPVKAACDFLLQPDVPVPAEFRDFFINEYIKYIRKDRDFLTRFKTVFPILALKWCLIILNDFQKNSFNDNVIKNIREKKRLELQIEKAEGLLGEIPVRTEEMRKIIEKLK